ncbi:hypothetical protein VTH06DRAFT_4943 [Thermothelomyces fergusii]
MDPGSPSRVIAMLAIEDGDLTFGGKPLCAWHEEHRRSLIARVVGGGGGDHEDGEERRRRERSRQHTALRSTE